jgi:hypothetical protein
MGSRLYKLEDSGIKCLYVLHPGETRSAVRIQKGNAAYDICLKILMMGRERGCLEGVLDGQDVGARLMQVYSVPREIRRVDVSGGGTGIL